MKREDVVSLRERLFLIAVDYSDRSAGEKDAITIRDARALCDHYLSTPAAEPTAGDARAAAERAWDEAMLEWGRPFVRHTRERNAIAVIERAIVAAQRQARPSLGAAADAVMAERERCARIADKVAADCEAMAAHGTSCMEHMAACAEGIAESIRASSPEGSPDGSPEGEGRIDTIIAEGHKRVRNIIDAYDPPTTPKAGADGEGA